MSNAKVDRLEAIKAKLRELSGEKPKKLVWKPTGEHMVRCLKLPNNDEELAVELGYHYGVNEGRKLFCPASVGDQCDFCDLANYLYAWKDEDGNDKPKDVKQRDFEWFKKIARGPKHYVPVIVRKEGDEFEGPFFWEMSPKTYKVLLEKCVDEDYNQMHAGVQGLGGYDILTNPEHGLDLNVRLLKANTPGNATSFDAVEVKERKTFTPLLKNQAARKAITERIPKITEAVKHTTSAEAAIAFKSFKASTGSQPAPDTKSPGVEYGEKEKKVESHNTEKLDGKGSIDDTISKINALVEKNKQQRA